MRPTGRVRCSGRHCKNLVRKHALANQPSSAAAEACDARNGGVRSTGWPSFHGSASTKRPIPRLRNFRLEGARSRKVTRTCTRCRSSHGRNRAYFLGSMAKRFSTMGIPIQPSSTCQWPRFSPQNQTSTPSTCAKLTSSGALEVVGRPC